MTDELIPAAAQRVRAFLERFYRAEASDDRAASAALQASLGDDPQERWRNAQAFARTIEAELPDGALQQLVFRASDRHVLTDDEAREFLQRVYDDNAFDMAIDYEATTRGQLGLPCRLRSGWPRSAPRGAVRGDDHGAGDDHRAT